MNGFTHSEICDGLITNNKAVINFLIGQIYPEIEGKVGLWYGGENKKKITKVYIFERFKKLKRICNKASAGISTSEVLDFSSKQFYDNFYQIEVVFNRLKMMGLFIVNKWFKLNPADKEVAVEDIAFESLEAFYLKYIRLFPEDQEKCNLKVYYRILPNKTISYINKLYKTSKGIKNPDIEEVNEAIKNYFLTEESGEYPDSIEDLFKETKQYRVVEPIDKIINTDDEMVYGGGVNQIYQDEEFAYLLGVFKDILDKDDIEIIARIAKEYIDCMIQHKISQICIQIILLNFYGLEHDEIRERVKNEKGKKYSKRGIITKVNRCRNTIMENCEKLKDS